MNTQRLLPAKLGRNILNTQNLIMRLPIITATMKPKHMLLVDTLNIKAPTIQVQKKLLA